MKCIDIRELLSAYADGELERTRREFVEEHLETCGACRAVLADYVEIGERLASLRTMAVKSKDMKEVVMDGIERANVHGRKRRVWQMAGAGAIVLALIIGLSLGLPALGGKSDHRAIAEEIARNSIAFEKASAGEGETRLVQVIEKGNEATVVFATESGKQITFHVDLEAGKMVEVKQWIGIKMGESPEGEMQRAEAIRIARADPRVEELLPEEPVVEMVLRFADEWGVIFLPTDIEEQPVVEGAYLLEAPMARVDLDAKQVIGINEGTMPVSAVEIVYGLSETEKQEAIEIATADPTVKEALTEGFVIEDVKRLPADFERIVDVTLMPGDAQGQDVIQGRYITVDLDKKEVTHSGVILLVAAPVIVVQIESEMTETDKWEAVEIANADPRVKELLAQGFIMEEGVSRVPLWDQRLLDIRLMPADAEEQAVVVDGNYVINGYYVRVDLDGKGVVAVEEYTVVKPPEAQP